MGNDRRRTVHAFYDNLAEKYDESRYGSDQQKAIDNATKSAYLQLMGQVARKKVLDSGCGSGRFSILLRQLKADVVSLDISHNMLNELRKKINGEGAFVRADTFSLPFIDQSFDIVICSQVLTHLHRYEEPLMEFARVLKKNGIILIDIRNILNPRCLYRSFLERAIVSLVDQLQYLPHYTHIFRIKSICNSAGLKLTKYIGIQGARCLPSKMFSQTLIARIEKGSNWNKSKFRV